MPTLKKTIILLWIQLIFCLPGLTQLRQIFIDKADPENYIRNISFYSANEGYVTFRDYIGFTKDSGRTFTKKYITQTNVDYNGYRVNILFGFYFDGVVGINANTFIAYGDYGDVPAILYTSNAGTSYKLVYHSQFDPMDLNTGIRDMIFPENGSVGYAVDADRVLKTIDGGLSWKTIHISEGAYFDNLEATDNNNVVAFSTKYGSAKAYKTTNGVAWMPMPLTYGKKINYLTFLNQNTGWYHGLDYDNKVEMFYTTNGGKTWVQKNDKRLPPFEVLTMRFFNDSTGYALSDLYEVYKTTDSGRIWERLPKDNNFSYLAYGFDDLHFRNSNQFWAGGGRGFLAMTTNGGGVTIPRPLFTIDTSGHLLANIVKLVNHSKPGYTHKWFVNNVPVSTGYHASYTRDINNLKDDIMLVASNGQYSDTLVRSQHFYPPLIVSSFYPTTASMGEKVTIKGKNFTNAWQVFFGGIRAERFEVKSDSVILATVGLCDTGKVTVLSYYSMGFLEGFIFLPPPIVKSFSPTTAKTGDLITITGENFQDISAVRFGGADAASYVVRSENLIEASVGIGGSGEVTVTGSGGTTGKPGFIVLPQIDSFTPLFGTFGTRMTITGSGLNGTISITIGGKKATSFKIISHSNVEVVVPENSTGDVVLYTAQSNFTKGGFEYHEPPAIHSFEPSSGPVGTRVTIKGINFGREPQMNFVYFGSMKGIVLSSNDSTLIVEVPAGATYEPLTVTSHNLTAYSSQPFVVTFPHGGSITRKSFEKSFDFSAGANRIIKDGSVGDIDGDGLIDLVVCNFSQMDTASYVSVFRNNTKGEQISFDSATNLIVSQPESLALSDLDGDGKLDIIALERGYHQTVLFRNTSVPGKISFQKIIQERYFASAWRFAVHDLDSDGKPDIVYNSHSYSFTGVYRNISNPGTFAFEPEVSIIRNTGNYLIPADVDNDGKPDIIKTGVIYRNRSSRGALKFDTACTLPSYQYMLQTAADLDRDGFTDIMIPQQASSQISLVQNRGAFQFSFNGEALVSSGPIEAKAADLDGDGVLDIAATFKNQPLAILKGTTNAGKISFAPTIYYGDQYLGPKWSSDAKRIVLGDLNNDGKPEALVFSPVYKKIKIFVNDIKSEPFISSFSPTIAEKGTIISIKGNNFQGVDSVSFGGVMAQSFTVISDSIITAIVGEGAAGEIKLTNQFGSGSAPGFSFGYPPLITGFSPASAPASSVVVINGNNFNTIADSNHVYFGNAVAKVIEAKKTSLKVVVPTGSFYSPISITTNHLTAYSDSSFVTTFENSKLSFTRTSFGDKTSFKTIKQAGIIGDLDGDGLPDVLSREYTFLMISRNISADSYIRLAEPIRIEVPFYANDAALADMDGDGKQDIVIISANKFAVFLNNSIVGNISFSPAQQFESGRESSGKLAIRDLDADGKPDIVIVSDNIQSVSIYKNLGSKGNLQFDRSIQYILFTGGIDLQIADVDMNGMPDIVVSTKWSNLNVFLNNSKGNSISFELGRTIFVNRSELGHLTVDDLNGDGTPEIGVTYFNGVAVFVNKSSGGNLVLEQVDLGLENSGDVWFNDLNGDGRPELVFQQYDSYNYPDVCWLSIYENIAEMGGRHSFAPLFKFPIGDATNQSIPADMDADGKVDVCLFKSGGSGFEVYRNKANEGTVLSICEKADHSIAAAIAGGVYQWQKRTDSGYVNLSNSVEYSGVNTDTLIIRNVPITWTGYQYRCVSSSDTSELFVLMVNPLPITKAGDDKMYCAGKPSIYIGFGNSSTYGNSYLWTPQTGIELPTYSSTKAAPDTTTVYILTGTSPAGCVAHDTMKVSVLEVAQPSISASALSSCNEGRYPTLTSSIAESYQWYLDGTAIIGSLSRTEVAVRSGKYTVMVTQEGCKSPMSPEVIISILPQPPRPEIKNYGNIKVCNGLPVELSTTEPGIYQWYRNYVPIVGANKSTYKVFQTGYYSVAKIETCISNPSKEMLVEFATVVSTPIITNNNNVLRSSSDEGNQWYLDGVAITGAVDQEYEVTRSGKYSVKVTANGCESGFSNEEVIVVVDGLVIGPNPVSGTVTLRYSNNRDPLIATVLDVYGHIVTISSPFVTGCQMDLSGLNPGHYVIEVTNLVTKQKERRVIIKI